MADYLEKTDYYDRERKIVAIGVARRYVENVCDVLDLLITVQEGSNQELSKVAEWLLHRILDTR